MHSIRFRMTAVMMAAILTCILTLSGLGLMYIGQESDQSSVEKMRLISDNMQSRLDAYLDSLSQSVDMAIHMARDSLEGKEMEYLGSSGTPEEIAKLDEEMTAHCAEVEHAFSSIANNTNGVVTYYYCINSDYGSNEHGFFWSRVDEEEFVKQPPLISTDLDPDDIEHTTWYYTPLKANSAVWLGPYKAHYLGERWTISYVSPIYHQGFLVGVLGMDILFDTMISLISPLKVYETGFVFLLDRDGRILYHPDLGIGTEERMEMEGLDEKLLRRRSTEDKLVRYVRNGEERQLAFSTLSNNMKVAVTAPVSEINAFQRRMMLQVPLVALILMAVFSVITLLVMNAMTKPLLQLASAARKLSDGDYDVPLDYDGKNEVGTLTNSFRFMRDHLKLYIRDLNSLAYSDALTGVKNKGAFTAYLAQINEKIRQGTENGYPEFAVVMSDVNNLKQINDSYGHEHGDQYLKGACQEICRTFDHSPVFRLGGDEFSVILTAQDYERRNQLMQELRHRIEERNQSAGDPWEQVFLSCGMAVYQPGQDLQAEQVVNRADEAMYEDKRHQKERAENGSEK